MKDEFDYIIVGAGSAGAVLAARLSADKTTRVLLLEAGRKGWHPYLHIPIGYGRVFHDARYNWKYSTAPEPHLNQRRIYCPRGKVLGGSSAINAMVYVRGCPQDYDEWEAVAPGWGWADVAPIFRQMEDWQGTPNRARGTGGALCVSDVKAFAHPTTHAYIKAAQNVGIAYNDDYNSDTMEGTCFYQINTRKGLRASTANAYLKPAASRRNLSIKTRALAERIIFDGRTARGVAYRRGGKTQTARATREVILCGGAINTPQLLQFSGIGNGALLQKMGINVILDQPHVGRHLRDHLGFELIYQATVPTLNQLLRPLWGKMRAGLEFLCKRQGLLTLSLNQSGGFVRTQKGIGAPDLQLYFVPMTYTTAPSGVRPLMNLDPFPGFRIGFNPCKPESHGYVEICAPDPTAPPKIVGNYLASPHDRQTMIAGTKLIKRIAESPALAAITDKIINPKTPLNTDTEILNCIRAHSTTIFHQCGTCRMGRDAKTSVTDNKLRVHGIKNLRIADASIFPTIPSGNTNAPTIMLAEKAARIIKNEPQ